MNNLGQALSFYLKYNNEIDELCDGDEDAELPKIDGLDEEGVRELIRKLDIVENDADKDFSLLRNKFNEMFESVLSETFKVRTISRRNWGVAFDICPKDLKRNKKDIIWIGMSLHLEHKDFKIWIWGAGGRIADSIFNETIKGIPGSTVGWEKGNQILKSIKINITDDNLDIDAGPIFKEVDTFLRNLDTKNIFTAYEKILQQNK